MSVVLTATDFSLDTIDNHLVQDDGQLFAYERTSYVKILAFSCVMEK